MIKRLLRSCVAAGCRGSGMLARAQAAAAGELMILCYHRVLPAADKAAYFAPDLVVTPESFRAHCRVLGRHFEVLPVAAALRAHAGRTGAARPLAAITFDDGYQDNYRYAAPILAETGLRATFFVVSDLVDGRQLPWYDRLARVLRMPEARSRIVGQLNGRLKWTPPGVSSPCGPFARQVVSAFKDLPPARRRELLDELESGAQPAEVSMDNCVMTTGQLRALNTAGHEIGSHTRTHEMLPQLDDAALDAEIAGSRRQLEQIVQAPVTGFCYPNGSLDDRVVRRVCSAGYSYAVTTQTGCNGIQQDRFLLRRWFIHEDRLSGATGRASGTLLRMEILGLADRVFARGRGRPAEKG